jgi:hypothetical protein
MCFPIALLLVGSREFGQQGVSVPGYQGVEGPQLEADPGPAHCIFFLSPLGSEKEVVTVQSTQFPFEFLIPEPEALALISEVADGCA